MLKQAMPFVLVRCRSVKNKARRMAASWPGRILFGLLLVVAVRLCWLYAQTPDPSSSSPVAPQTALTALGLLAAAGSVALGLRAVTRPPVVLALGDLAVVDSGALVRPAVVAGLAARVVAPAVVSFLAVPLVVAVSPMALPTVGSRVGAWLVLWAFGIWVTTARVLTSCVAWCISRGDRWARGLWWTVGAGLAATVAVQANAANYSGLPGTGRLVERMLRAAPVSILVLVALALVMGAAVVHMASRMVPTWSASLYQAAAILDLASTNDATGALALTQKSQTRSLPFPAIFRGPSAYFRRQHVEATRRRMTLGLLAQYAVGLGVCWAAARYLPDLWWLAFLGLGGFAASVCAQDGALYESRYPFFMFGAGGLGARCFWASALGALRMCGFMASTLVGGLLGAPGTTQLGLALGCAIGWPVFASACSSAAAIVATRGGRGRIRDSAASIASLGGPIAYSIGLLPSRLVDPMLLAFAPVVALAAASWLVLYLAWSTTSAPNRVSIVRA